MQTALVTALLATLQFASPQTADRPMPMTSLVNGGVGCAAFDKAESRWKVGIPPFYKVAVTVLCSDPYGNLVGMAFDKKGRVKCWATGTAELVLCGTWLH